jgi:hypothetical protein
MHPLTKHMWRFPARLLALLRISPWRESLRADKSSPASPTAGRRRHLRNPKWDFDRWF